MKTKILLSFIFVFALMSFVSATTVTISSPSEGAIFNSDSEDVLVQASIDIESTCDVWGYVDTPNGRKDINPRECDICSKGSGGTYANSISAYIDAVAGGNYEMHVTCRDRSGQMDTKIVNFQVSGNMATDTTAPIVTINFPTQGGNPYSNINLDFDVNELSSCRYSVSPQDYNGGSGIGFSGYINGKVYETSLKQSTPYSLTVTCTDLMDNVGSKTISFTTQNRACSTCAVPSNGTSPSNGSGGGSGGTNTSNMTSPSSGGGGGSGGSSKCEKFYNCSDGSQVQYCFIHKFYNENGEVVGAGCGCKSNPEELCTSSSSGGGGGSGEPIEIPSSGSSGGGGGSGNNATPIICNGCILGDKCVPVGYRTNDKYCNIESELVNQLEADNSCNNNFECSTNLCIDNQCVSSGLWQKFIRWLSRLFG